MLYQVQTIFSLFEQNLQENIIAGVILMSAIIVFLGLLKPILFNRIKFKPMRKSLLFISCIALCFISTAIRYLIVKYPFDTYITSSIILCVITSIEYLLYENTCLRNLIHKIGIATIKKVADVAISLLNDSDKEEIKKEIERVSKELSDGAKTELKKSLAQSKDNELNNL